MNQRKKINKIKYNQIFDNTICNLVFNKIINNKNKILLKNF